MKYQIKQKIKLLVVTNSIALNYFTENANTWQDVHSWLDQRYGSDGYDLIDLADRYGGNSPNYAVVDSLIEAQWDQAKYWAVFIIGGHSVVPHGEVNSQWDGSLIWTDDYYGDVTHDIVPEVPVARLPDGGSYNLLYTQFNGTSPAENSYFAMVNGYHTYVERFAARFNGLYYSPGFNRNTAAPQGVDSGFVYFDLVNNYNRNNPNDPFNNDLNRLWWGWDPYTNAYVPAFSYQDARTSGVVLASTSYAGFVPGCTAPGCPNTANLIPLEFLKNGSRAYIGTTVYNYSFPNYVCYQDGMCTNTKRYDEMEAGLPIFAEQFLQANGINSPLAAYFVAKLRMIGSPSNPTTVAELDMAHGLVYYGVPDFETECINCAEEFTVGCPSGDLADCDGDHLLDETELWLVNTFKPYLIYHKDDIDFQDGQPPPMYFQVTPGFYDGKRGAWLTMVVAYQWDGGAPKFDSTGIACNVYGCLAGAIAGSVSVGPALGCGVGAAGIEEFVNRTELGAIVAMHKGDTEGLRFFLVDGPNGWYISHIDWKRHFHEKFGDPQPVGEIGYIIQSGGGWFDAGDVTLKDLDWQADPITGQPTHPILYVAHNKHAVYPFAEECNDAKFHIISEKLKWLPKAIDCVAKTETCGSFKEGNAFGIFLDVKEYHNVGEREGFVLDTSGGNIQGGYWYNWHNQMQDYPGNFAWSYGEFCGGMNNDKVSSLQAHACGGGLANKWFPSNP